MKPSPLFLSLAAIALLGAGCLNAPIPTQALPNVVPITPPAAVVPTLTTPPAAPAKTPTTTIAPTKTTIKPKTAAPTPAPTPVKTPTYAVTFVTNEMTVSAILNAYGASLSWGRTSGASFKAYAVVKSTTDSNPYYPKQEGTHYVYDKDSTQWNDNNVEKGKRTYYRICAIAADDTVRCGKTTSVLR